jgi:hypothetical protein
MRRPEFVRDLLRCLTDDLQAPNKRPAQRFLGCEDVEDFHDRRRLLVRCLPADDEHRAVSQHRSAYDLFLAWQAGSNGRK